MNNTYVFGLDLTKEPFVACFNPDSLRLSQMTLPQDLKIHKHTSVLYIGLNSILITGGVTKTKKISSEILIYHPLTNKCTALPDLLQFRYAHCAVHLNGTVYILGGRTYGCDFTSLTNSVEAINLTTKEQRKCAPMQKRRCTFSSFVYQNEIYVIGGYSGSKRTKVIEKYNPEKNTWKKLEIRLPRGLEGLQVFSYRPDEIVLLGGNMDDGETANTHVINLQNSTIKFLPQMNHARIMHQISYNGDYLFVFGGHESGKVQRAQIEPSWTWQPIDMTLIDTTQFNTDADFTAAHEHNFSCKTTVVSASSSESKKVLIPHQTGSTISQSVTEAIQSPSLTEEKTESIGVVESIGADFKEEVKKYEFDDDSIQCFFGNDDKPFVMQISQTNSTVTTVACPIELPLLCYMGGVQINKNQIFISGGIRTSLSSISRNCYIYNLKTNRAQKLPKMQYPRYAHQCVLQGDYVYVLGGRGYQGDKLSLYNCNERFNLENNQWESIACLNEAKCSFSAFVIKDQVMVVGGYLGDGNRSKIIQKYDSFLDQWQTLDVTLNIEMEAAFALPFKHNSILLFGGKGNEKDLNSIKELKFSSDSVNLEGTEGETEVGQMKVERCLQKCIQVSPASFVIFGGNKDQIEENFVELVHLNSDSDTENYFDLCSKLSGSFQFMNLGDKIPSMLFV